MLQHVGVFLSEDGDPAEAEALGNAAREAQAQCIEVLQAAETF